MEKKPVKEETNPYKLLELIPRKRPSLVKIEYAGGRRSPGCSDEKKFELKLGLPGNEEESWSSKSKPKGSEGYNGNHHPDHQLLSLDYFSSATHINSSNRNNTASCSQDKKQDFPAPWGYVKEPSQPCCSRVLNLPQTYEKNKAFSPPSANTAVANNSQKRAAPAPVVGWPPVRSFRKKIASSSSAKPVPDPPSAAPAEKATENCHKGLFVKINMDGVPIGRKVDLITYNSYDKLCSAVDNLFRGLLASTVQRDSTEWGTQNKQEWEKAITGLLDGSGEYALVYEDNEGDRMLVGDVPWHMFVSTVKRLRVWKSSEQPSLIGRKGSC